MILIGWIIFLETLSSIGNLFLKRYGKEREEENEEMDLEKKKNLI